MDETAWLVEIVLELDYGFGIESRINWVGYDDGILTCVTDPNKALRFSRKVDADNFKSYWCETATSVEHMWCD